MQPLAVALAALDGMPEGMAEVEDRPATRFPLVFRDDFGLEFARALDCMCQGVSIARNQCFDVVLEPGKEIDVRDCPVFDDFGKSGLEFPVAVNVSVYRHR